MSAAKSVERAMHSLSTSIVELQRENEALRGYLRRIKAYQSVEKMRRDSEKDWGLPFEEALEMAYENVIGEAENALRWKPVVLTKEDIERIGENATKDGSAINRNPQRA